ncbi:MAG: TIGR03013 family PEP-CTERM/XrtA system glycosyltransferase [Acetobacteraceae bacterium]|nr:TIGR03013 family PEP-CTERM/XrtA system glycosyltransferase [Acetobacteraceae bacterium]
MTRVFGHYVSLEMTLLCVIELLLSFLLIYATLVFGGLELGAPGLTAAAADLAAGLAFTIGAMAVTIGLYRPEICRERRRLLVNAAVTGVLAFPAVLLVSEALHVSLSQEYVLWLANVLVAWMLGLFAVRALFGLVMRQNVFTRRVLVIGEGARAAQIRSAINTRLGPAAAAELHEPLSLEVLKRNRISAVVVTSEARPSMPTDALLRCKLSGVRILDEARFSEQQLGYISLDDIAPEWMVFADGFHASAVQDGIRRLNDILISLGVLLFTLPLMLAIALLIKLDSPGPVLYRQERVGLHGRVFTLFKFRSMRVDAEAGGRPRWAAQNDPRITRIGAFIRATRIDELPQLLNVLRGEMSFVGPRPERPHFVDQLAPIIPFYEHRASVKPGITGWAQVNYPYGASVEDARAKLSYDLYYVKNRSLFLDLLILVATVRVILFQEGAR